MLVENQMIEIKWSSKIRKHYESILDDRGNQKYQFTSKGDSFVVDVNEISKGSRINLKCKCDNCEVVFMREAKRVFSNKVHFCTKECSDKYYKIKGNPLRKRVLCNCDYCNKEYELVLHRYEKKQNGESKNLFCSKECKNKYQSVNNKGENNPNYDSIKTNCKVCNEEMTVPKYRLNTAKYCSTKCRQIGTKKTVTTSCGNCDCSMETIPSKIDKSSSGLVFCSNKCVGEYNSKRHLDNRIEKECVICKTNYTVKPSEADTNVTCSRKCQNKWQSLYLVGENANNYNHNIPKEDRVTNCPWCEKKFQLKSPYQVNILKENKRKLFCSKECYREWYAKEWSQQDEWREISRERTVNMICEGLFNHTDTKPQIILNEMLNKLKVKYENEHNCKVVAIDNYLSDHHLMIEVNGGFWHCDPRTYSIIPYQRQYDRIISDRRKKALIKSQYDIDILYLWEHDLINKPQLCECLIESYIDNKGILKDYNSFNYKLIDNKLVLDVVHKAYIDYDLNDLHNSFQPVSGEKRNHRQEDKWITFNCEQCGSEKEQLISKYNKSKHHFCSVECGNVYKRNQRLIVI